jgi:DNA-binding response OmpR family regulator
MAQTLEGSMTGARKFKIIVMDDSLTVRETVREILEENGFDAVALANPYDLSSALNTEKPDLVLADVGMPGLRGDKLVEITRRYKRLHQCPIVLHSALPAEELAELTKSCGAAGYICKTDEPEELIAEVKKFLPPA